ncbi:MAG: molybdate ABC transporter permease subunit [Myxococcota bacterium]
MSRLLGTMLAGLLIVLLALPLLGLVFVARPRALGAVLFSPAFLEALGLSLGTTALSLLMVITAGTRLAWSLATSRPRPWLERLLLLPIVMPPAVLGVALLSALGTQGIVGPFLQGLGLRLPFSTTAVVLVQVVVATPFYVQAALAAFRRLDPELLLVARSLGSTPWESFRRVGLPLALPGLISGLSLAAARALGEFGATLMFAGNAAGRTQTLPLLIYEALERDVTEAASMALLLLALATLFILGPNIVRRL